MDITFDPKVSQSSPMRSAQFVSLEKKASKTAGQVRDRMELSRDGQQVTAEAKGLELDQSREGPV